MERDVHCMHMIDSSFHSSKWNIVFDFLFKGANVAAERSFSMVKKLWTNDRSELSLTRIRSLMLIKFNCNQNCLEFYNNIKEQRDILNAINSGEKYKEDKTRMTHRALQLGSGRFENDEEEEEDECFEED